MGGPITTAARPTMPISEFREAQERYARIRHSAYRIVEKRIEARSSIPVHLADIDRHALAIRRRTWTYPHWSGAGGWNWDKLAHSVLRRPSGFPVAVWSGDRLLGLAVGRASRRRASGMRHTLSIHYVEAHPDPLHPLRRRVLRIVFNAAEEYGRLLGAKRLRLMDPLPELAPRYRSMGFGIEGQCGRFVYLERRIDPEPEHRDQP